MTTLVEVQEGERLVEVLSLAGKRQRARDITGLTLATGEGWLHLYHRDDTPARLSLCMTPLACRKVRGGHNYALLLRMSQP
jgi:hypothetical protein